MDTKPLLRAIDKGAREAKPIEITHVDPTLPSRTLGEQKLTYKQQVFAECMAKGATQVASYRQAYVCDNMTSDTIFRNSTTLASNSKVAARIREIVELEQQVKQHDPERIRVMLTNYLETIVTSQTEKTSDRNKAAELLGKVTGVGLFQAQAIVKPDELADTKQAVTDLQRKLELLLKPKLAS